MNEQSTLPSFLELATLFEKIQLNKHPSQIHGLLCGYLCGPSRDLNLLWHIIFENKPESPELRHLLQEWVEIIDRELIAFEFDIILVLPEDEADINLRAESLGLWCQGF